MTKPCIKSDCDNDAVRVDDHWYELYCQSCQTDDNEQDNSTANNHYIVSSGATVTKMAGLTVNIVTVFTTDSDEYEDIALNDESDEYGPAYGIYTEDPGYGIEYYATYEGTMSDAIRQYLNDK